MCQALNDYVNGAREESGNESILIGKKEEKKNIVFRILNYGLFTHEQIEMITGMSIEKIKNVALLFG